MATEELKEKAKAVIADLLPDVDSEQITEEADIFELGLDSINAMTLVFNLQEAFGVKFEASDISLENFRTIADITRLISAKAVAL